jgi:hypothetical protein
MQISTDEFCGTRTKHSKQQTKQQTATATATKSNNNTRKHCEKGRLTTTIPATALAKIK